VSAYAAAHGLAISPRCRNLAAWFDALPGGIGRDIDFLCAWLADVETTWASHQSWFETLEFRGIDAEHVVAHAVQFHSLEARWRAFIWGVASEGVRDEGVALVKRCRLGRLNTGPDQAVLRLIETYVRADVCRGPAERLRRRRAFAACRHIANRRRLYEFDRHRYAMSDSDEERQCVIDSGRRTASTPRWR